MSDFRKLAQDIGAAPLGDLIASVGKSVAEAQAALDASSLEQSLSLYDQTDDVQRIMRETGYRPAFYTIPETEGELKLSLSITGQQTAKPNSPQPVTPTILPSAALLSRARAGAARIYATPVDGRYQNSYSFSSQVSATVKFKIIAIPPPSEAEIARVVPDLVGMTLPEATRLAESFNLGLENEGAADAVTGAKVSAQNIASGELVPQGTLITVKLG